MKQNLNTFAPSVIVANENTSAIPVLEKGARVVIIGAGAFGGWSALWLLRSGFNVTLIDAWGSGNSRSSSGDETRVIRSTYGNNDTYFDLNVRALQLWKEHEGVFGRQIFYNTGVLWLCYESATPLVDESIPFAVKHDNNYEHLTREALQKKYSLINCGDLDHGFLDPHGGYLKARESTIQVQQAFIREGGNYMQRHVKPGIIQGAMTDVVLDNGNKITGDLYLFACGAWLAKLFPDVLHDVISCTKQEVYYFGPPANKAAEYDNLPVWVDVDGQDFYYGIPGNAGRGFKIGVDIRGQPFDPTSGEHEITPEVLQKAKTFIGHRFPGLKHAPVVESRVCPYENSPDGNFIFDRHPKAENVLFLGGGSGHGFKHGPALGELVAEILRGNKVRPSLFSLLKPRGSD